MDKQKTTNILLLIIAVPVVFYVLKLLSFIFVPLVFSMFVAVLFLPLMRWFSKKKVPKFISITVVVLIILCFFGIVAELIQLSSKEILSSDTDVVKRAKYKIGEFIISVEDYLGIKRMANKSISSFYLEKIDLSKNVILTVDMVKSAISMILMTVLFVVLWTMESLNFQKVLNASIVKGKVTSVKIFMKIEKDIFTFLKVKFMVSLGTGIAFTIACYAFDVSLPIFWGLFAFAINFVQMIGSIISVILLSLFAMLEIKTTGNLLFFMAVITGIQGFFGGVLEPFFMGKSFKISVIAIIVMLMFWGFLWGIPGMILAIPLTVFLKIILSQFKSTQNIVNVLFGS